MPTILVCDDEKDIVSALEIYLHAEGYDTVAAYNGHDAIERLREQEIQLILFHPTAANHPEFYCHLPAVEGIDLPHFAVSVT